MLYLISIVLVILLTIIGIIKYLAIAAVHRFRRVHENGYINSAGILNMLYIYITAPGKSKKSRFIKVFDLYKEYGRNDGIFHTFFGPFSSIV
jgi:hypothetical protein